MRFEALGSDAGPLVVDPNWFNASCRQMYSARFDLPEGIELADDQPNVYRDDDRDPLDEIVINDGVAIVPIHGMITKRGSYWWSRVFSCDSNCLVLQKLRDDPKIKAIVLDIDSGGGTVSGTGGLADAIFALRGTKKVVAVINELAASGAYWIGSAAEEVVITSNAQAGSIGAYLIHFDASQWEKDNGFKTTIVRSGKYKAAGIRPMDSDVAEHMQGIVDTTYSAFIEVIAKHRSYSSEVVQNTMADARIFIGQQAVDAGLADRVGSLDQVVEELSTINTQSDFGATNYGRKVNGNANARNATSKRVRRIRRR